MNAEQIALAERVLAQVEAEPVSLYMGTWESPTNNCRVDWTRDGVEVAGCGTTRCMAGWTVHLAKKSPQEESRVARLRLARELECGPSWSEVARRLLGLTHEEADLLFLDLEEAEAVAWLKRRVERAKAGVPA